LISAGVKFRNKKKFRYDTPAYRSISSTEGGQKDVCIYKEQYPGTASRVLPTISPIYGVNPSISPRCDTQIFSVRTRKETTEYIKVWNGWGSKTWSPEDGLVIWMGQVTEKNWTATDGVIKDKKSACQPMCYYRSEAQIHRPTLPSCICSHTQDLHHRISHTTWY
jgi:hypothetical protein